MLSYVICIQGTLKEMGMRIGNKKGRGSVWAIPRCSLLCLKMSPQLTHPAPSRALYSKYQSNFLTAQSSRCLQSQRTASKLWRNVSKRRTVNWLLVSALCTQQNFNIWLVLIDIVVAMCHIWYAACGMQAAHTSPHSGTFLTRPNTLITFL